MATQAAPDGLVWHYTDAAGLLGIVRGHTLWATASGFLNDRAEIDLGVSLVREIAQERADQGDVFARTILERMGGSADGTPSPTLFFILSAARDPDLLAMWRLYGGRGESYAIGLDPDVPLSVLAAQPLPTEPAEPAELAEPTDPAEPVAVQPPREGGWGGRAPLVLRRPWSAVRYAEQDQRRLASAVLDGLPEEMDAMRTQVSRGVMPSVDEARSHFAETIDDVEQAMFLIKHGGFADEREIRYCATIVAPDGNPYLNGVVDFRASAYGLAPFLRLTGGGEEAVVTTPTPLPIRALSISPTSMGARAAESAGALLRAHGYDVPITRSSIPYRE